MDSEGVLPDSSPQPSRTSRGFTCTRLVLGILLLTAAVLKLSDSSWEPLGRTVLLAPHIRWLLIEYEIVLGIWLLAGFAQRLARAVALLSFGGLAAISLVLGLNGEPSCGCFGKVVVSPWWALTLDLLAILALAAFRRPAGAATRQGVTWQITPPGTVAISGALTFAAVSLWFVVAHGGIGGALAAVTAEPLSLTPSLADLGTGMPKETREFAVEVYNRTDRVVRVIGGTENCSCSATRDLPVDIPPRGSRIICVRGGFTGPAGTFHREFVLHAHDPEGGLQEVARGRFIGRVTDGLEATSRSAASAE